MANEPLDDETLQYMYEYNNYYDKRVNEGLKNKAQAWNITFKDGSILNLGSGSDLTNHLDMNGFKPDGYYCTVGINSMVVLPDGKVTLSRCEYLKNKVVGNIFDIDNIKLPTEPIICHLNGDVDQNKRCDLCAGSNIYRD